jgi:sigma-54 dependent transcriptional regulator, putative
VPPLRARKEDILPLAKAFLHKYSIETGSMYFDFSEHSVKAMENYRWPGNIRELENAVARACIIGTPPVIRTADLRLTLLEETEEHSRFGAVEEIASVVASARASDRTLKNALNIFKRTYLIKILEECSWNQTRAGKILGIQRTYVSRLMNELNVREERK